MAVRTDTTSRDTCPHADSADGGTHRALPGTTVRAFPRSDWNESRTGGAHVLGITIVRPGPGGKANFKPERGLAGLYARLHL